MAENEGGATRPTFEPLTERSLKWLDAIKKFKSMYHAAMATKKLRFAAAALRHLAIRTFAKHAKKSMLAGIGGVKLRWPASNGIVIINQPHKSHLNGFI
jgi:hypothetical protein